MNEEQVRAALRAACKKAGGQKAWGDANGVSQQYISDVLQGRREPAGKMLVALGVERVVTYRKVRR